MRSSGLGGGGIIEIFLAATLLALVAGLAGCGGWGNRVELTVSAAASLKGALAEAADVYMQKNPAVKVTLNFGSSGSLKRQIEQGAPADVFISAGEREMDSLEEQGLIDPGSRRDILANQVALVEPAASAVRIEDWEDLAGPRVRRVAIGIPETVPAGQYGREVLERLGLWEQLQPKLVFCRDVLQAASYVRTGNVDAGIVFLTDSRLGGLRLVAEAPTGSHQPAVYPAAAVKSSRHLEEAGDFLSFLASREAAAVFSKYGFTPLGNGG